jgi:shikimate dehydrogenase
LGWNVTVPHKQRMLAHLHEMSQEVRAIGACNTVRVHDDGRLEGFNTDTIGFVQGLRAVGGISEGADAVLLGAGGAARAVAYALASAGHSVLVLARRSQQAEQLAGELAPFVPLPIRHGRLDRPKLEEALREAELLVNCTPAGMWPHEHETPLPEGTHLPAHLLVYDLIYNPRPTRLLRQAQAAGCRTQDGLEMLVQQGAACFQIWTGRRAPITVMRKAVAG